MNEESYPHCVSWLCLILLLYVWKIFNWEMYYFYDEWHNATIELNYIIMINNLMSWYLWYEMNRRIVEFSYLLVCFLVFLSLMFYSFYNLALKMKKLNRVWKSEALFISFSDQISIQFFVSHEWFLQINIIYFFFLYYIFVMTEDTLI